MHYHRQSAIIYLIFKTTLHVCYYVTYLSSIFLLSFFLIFTAFTEKVDLS